MSNKRNKKDRREKNYSKSSRKINDDEDNQEDMEAHEVDVLEECTPPRRSRERVRSGSRSPSRRRRHRRRSRDLSRSPKRGNKRHRSRSERSVEKSSIFHSDEVESQTKNSPVKIVDQNLVADIDKNINNAVDNCNDKFLNDTFPNRDDHLEPLCDEVDEEILEVFGADPTQSNKVNVIIHPSFKPHWQYWVNSGLKREEIDELTNKYEPEEIFSAPSLNPEIRATLTESALKRDGHFEENQKMIGSSLTSLGAAMTMIINEPKEPPDRAILMERLFEAGKLMAGLFQKITVSRKIFTEPGLSRQVKDVLSRTKTDRMLYGAELSTKIKESRTISNVGQTLKNQVQQSRKGPGTPKNWNFAQARRPFAWARRNTNTYGQARQLQSSRSRGRPYQGQRSYYSHQRGAKTGPQK